MAGKLFGGRYRDHAAAATGLELDGAGTRGEDRVVPADAGPVARLELGPALAHDDLAAGDGLAGEDLHAEALGLRVAPVATRSETFLMSHPRPPSSSSPPAAWASTPGPSASPAPCPSTRGRGASASAWPQPSGPPRPPSPPSPRRISAGAT